MPPPPLPHSKLPAQLQAMGFQSRSDANAFLLANTNYMIAAVHMVFVDDLAVNPVLQGFVVQTNTTVSSLWPSARGRASQCVAP